MEDNMTVIDRANRMGQAQSLLNQKQIETNKLAELGAQTVKAQEEAQFKAQLDKAHQVGMQDGAQATVQSLYPGLARPAVGQDPMNYGGGATNAEVERAKAMFGTNSVDMRDIELMRRLDTLDTSNKPNY